MRTSLGIWALGPMVTRFVPDGYQPERAAEPMPDKVARAVGGLGDLMTGYECHYPGELNEDNLDAVREALAGHDVACVATGLPVDRRSGKAAVTNPDAGSRREARATVTRAPTFAASVGANLICWPGGEGYN